MLTACSDSLNGFPPSRMHAKIALCGMPTRSAVPGKRLGAYIRCFAACFRPRRCRIARWAGFRHDVERIAPLIAGLISAPMPLSGNGGRRSEALPSNPAALQAQAAADAEGRLLQKKPQPPRLPDRPPCETPPKKLSTHSPSLLLGLCREVRPPCGSPLMTTMKSVSLPVSLCRPSSEMISDEAGSTTAEMRSRASGVG